MKKVIPTMDSKSHMHLLAGVAAGAMLLCSTSAMAQSAADADKPDGEIIVTAQKRAEALEKVPISIAAVSSESLSNNSITLVRELPQAVPSMRVNYAGTFVLPTIRGVGSIVALPGLVQNIATYVDGFYVPTPSASNFDLVNVESVNVLKGPQGTLFGANATGGAIMINTRKPQQELSGLVRAGYASYNDFSAAAYVTGGLGSGISADIAASYERGDGYITNVYDNNDKVAKFHKWAVRPQVLIEPTDNLSVLLAYEHTYTNDPGTQMVVARNGISIGSPIFPGNVGSKLVFNSPKRVSLDFPGHAIRETNSYTAKINLDLGFADLASYTGYRTDKIDQALDYEASTLTIPGAVTARQWTVPDKTFSQEIDITSKKGTRFDWVIGAFYLDYQDDYTYHVSPNKVTFIEAFKSHNYAKSTAVFAEGTYQPVDNLYITLGGRYTHDKPCVSYANPAALGKGCVTFNDFAMRAVARYELTPSSSIYASFSQGYRSGGLPASGFSTTAAVKPENIDAYEVGYKLGGGPVRLNLAAFFYDYRDIQVTSYLDGGASQTVNAGRAHIYGLDGDLTWKATDDLSFTLAGAWIDARYTDFGHYNAAGSCIGCSGAFTFGTTPGTPIYGQIVPKAVPATGNRVERTPRFSGSASVNYGFDMAGGRMKLNANLFYTGKYYFDPAHQLINPSYTLLNLRATWTDPSDHIDVSIYGKNVTNETYFRSNFLDPLAARATYGEPAVIGGSVTYRF